MSKSHQKFICEVCFRDFRTNKILRITGKTDIDNLITPKKKIIIIENTIFQNQHWKKILCKIPKVDIIKINAYKAQLILNYDKGTLIVDQKSIQDFQDKHENKYESINALF